MPNSPDSTGKEFAKIFGDTARELFDRSEFADQIGTEVLNLLVAKHEFPQSGIKVEMVAARLTNALIESDFNAALKFGLDVEITLRKSHRFIFESSVLVYLSLYDEDGNVTASVGRTDFKFQPHREGSLKGAAANIANQVAELWTESLETLRKDETNLPDGVLAKLTIDPAPTE